MSAEPRYIVGNQDGRRHHWTVCVSCFRLVGLLTAQWRVVAGGTPALCADCATAVEATDRKIEGQVVGFAQLTLAFRREGQVWVGICQELGTSTSARTLNRAAEELREMVLCHLNALEQEGERESFFEKHGVKFSAESDVPLPDDHVPLAERLSHLD